MSDRFVVEADRKVVGVAVRVPGGFRFYSSDPDFTALEAKTFKRVRAMFRRVAQLARTRGRPVPGRSRRPGWGRVGRRAQRA